MVLPQMGIREHLEIYDIKIKKLSWISKENSYVSFNVSAGCGQKCILILPWQAIVNTLTLHRAVALVQLVNNDDLREHCPNDAGAGRKQEITEHNERRAHEEKTVLKVFNDKT